MPQDQFAATSESLGGDQFLKSPGQVLRRILLDEFPDRLADHLLRFVAEDVLDGGGVVEDYAVAVDDHHAVPGVVDDGLEPLPALAQLLLDLLESGHVRADAAHGPDAPCPVDEGELGRDEAQHPVCQGDGLIELDGSAFLDDLPVLFREEAGDGLREDILVVAADDLLNSACGPRLRTSC